MARLWNEALLEAIRRDVPRVTVHARNLFHVSAAMFDAWAAYSGDDLGYYRSEAAVPAAGQSLRQARREAVSFAAYRVLSHRFETSPGHQASQAEFDALLDQLGYDATLTGTDGPQPWAVGNRASEAVIVHGLSDGANESANYLDPEGYTPVNVPMLVAFPGTGGLADINAWRDQRTVLPDTPLGIGCTLCS